MTHSVRGSQNLQTFMLNSSETKPRELLGPINSVLKEKSIIFGLHLGEYLEWNGKSYNGSLQWLGSTSDGVGYFDVPLADGLLASRPFYFVTTEALYGHLETYMYKNSDTKHVPDC